MLHGLYDAIAFSLEGLAGLIGLLGMTMIAWVILLSLIKKALALSPVRWGAPAALTAYPIYPIRFCTECGTRREIGSRFCVTCGHPFPKNDT